MSNVACRCAFILLGLVLLFGCATPDPVLLRHLPPDAAGIPVELDATPFYPQAAHQCGPAALATALGASDVKVTPDVLAPQVYLPAREGSLQAELIAATRRYDRLPVVVGPHLADLLAELRGGHPVLVLQNLGTRSFPFWHYAVVVGYLPERDQVILRSGTEWREVLAAGRFLETWELAGSWGLVVLAPGELPAANDPQPYLEAVAGLESTGRLRAAEMAYAAATKRWPDDPTAWLGLGNAAYREGRLEGAGTSYLEAIRADPGYAAAYNNLAEVVAALGCFDAALSTLARGLTLPGATARRLGDTLDETRREILSRRPQGYRGDAPACSRWLTYRDI